MIFLIGRRLAPLIFLASFITYLNPTYNIKSYLQH
jgi:hypothetical protein